MLLWDLAKRRYLLKAELNLFRNWRTYTVIQLNWTLHWLELNNDITVLLKLLYSRFCICLIIEVCILFCTILWSYYLYCVKHYRNKGKEQQEHGHRVSQLSVTKKSSVWFGVKHKSCGLYLPLTIFSSSSSWIMLAMLETFTLLIRPLMDFFRASQLILWYSKLWNEKEWMKNNYRVSVEGETFSLLTQQWSWNTHL